MFARVFSGLVFVVAAAVTLPPASAKDVVKIAKPVEKPATKFDFDGWAGVELRVFPRQPLYPGQDDDPFQTSLALAPKFSWSDTAGKWALDFAPYYRWDAIDDERSHGDIREAAFNVFEDGFDLRLGISKVYWGVTEARQLVDIVNQTDQVESFDGDEKLGQPMAFLRGSISNYGFDVLVLPGFRERTFSGVKGRLRTALPINEDDAQYESSAKNNRVDLAGRLKAQFGEFDVGLSLFHGTSREPRFVVSGGYLLPYYDVIDQVGLDMQATIGATLYKLEAITRDGHGGASTRRFAAVVAGIEHTFYQVGNTSWDLGLVVEGLWDDRPPSAPPTIYDHDLFVGTRIQFNDTGDSSALIGLLTDVDNGSMFLTLEGSARIEESWRLEFEGALAIYVDDTDFFLDQFRNDSHIMIRLPRYF